MARKHPKFAATQERTLDPVAATCWECGQLMWVSYHNQRRLITLQGPLDIRIPI